MPRSPKSTSSDGEAATRWLSDEEQATWRSLLLTFRLLDDALDRQLTRDAGLPQAYYLILVVLSETPDHRLRMADLAKGLRYSQSRLTHAITSMERQGWVERQPCPDDRRGQNAVLTDAGMTALQSAARGHVAEVRAHVFDRLSTEQVGQLHAICSALLDGLDTSDVMGFGCPGSSPLSE